MERAWEQNIEIYMIADPVPELPPVPLAEGLRMRAYRSDDEHHWLAVHEQADPYLEYSKDTFATQVGPQFGALHEQLPLRQLYVEKDGRAVATSTAWTGSQYWGFPAGQVHWVAVAPDCQRQGIGRAVVAATLARIIEIGHRRVFLSTSTIRLPAVRLYLSLGLRPGWRSAREQEIWWRLCEAPELLEQRESMARLIETGASQQDCAGKAGGHA